MKLVMFIILMTVASLAKEKSYSEMSLDELQKVNSKFRDEYFSSLTSLIEKSVEKNDCSAVNKYAPESFKVAEIVKDNWESGGWNYGNAIFSSHMALGFCQLKENNLKKAKDHLKKAAKSPGSPQLDTFGLRITDMRLATELLKKGEKKAVIDFLNECRKFWKENDAQKYINTWIKNIEANKLPNFAEFIE